MLAPGMTINSSNQVVVNRSSGNSSNFINEGFGFKTAGALCMDTAVVAASDWSGGIRINSTGCVFCTTSTNASDIWINGLRVSASGQLIVEVAVGTSFVNGNPLTANGVLAVNA